MTDAVENEDAPVMRGILVFYMNVGALPPYKAEVFLERMREQLLRPLQAASRPLPEDVGVLFVPVRPPDQTRVDYLPLDAVSRDALAELRAIREHFIHTYQEVAAELQLTVPKKRTGFFGMLRNWYKKLFP